MSVFITGSTGFIGVHLVNRLAESGQTIHALYRSEEKKKMLKHPNIKLFNGDIMDINSLEKAMEGCKYVYHVAAFTKIWSKNENTVYELNVNGTKNVLDAALKLGIKKVIFTSTAGIFGPSITEKVDENSVRKIDYFLEYEKSKAKAEELIKSYSKNNMEITIVNPTRVYGPGLLSKSNSVTIMMQAYTDGKWRFIPGDGRSIGNYVFIDDVVNGHILAMEFGKNGEKYLLGGTDLNYIELFSILRKITGKKYFMLKIPFVLISLMAEIMLLFSKIFNIPPAMTPSLIKKFSYSWEVSSQKAINELGYSITPFETGAIQTLQWFNKKNDYEK